MPWKRQKVAHNFKGRGFWKKIVPGGTGSQGKACVDRNSFAIVVIAPCLCPPPLEYRLFYHFMLTRSMEQPAWDSEED